MKTRLFTKTNFLLWFLFFYGSVVFGQGLNHQWLMGYWPFQYDKGRMLIDSNGYSLLMEQRKIEFLGAEANISDTNGNLLMSSNGAWIANANNDTMLNGGGLNPSAFTTNWPTGFPINFINMLLPYPGNPNKYVLFHKTLWGTLFPAKTGIYKSIIDITHDGGLGEVIDKNDTILIDTLSWGIGACKHANGRDWWVVVMREYNPTAFTFLLTPNGIDTMMTQPLGFISGAYGISSPIVFSQDGTKMIFCTPTNQNQNGMILKCDFDRCNGQFSNLDSLHVSSNDYLWGLAFSPSGNYIYACNSNYIFQIDSNLIAVDTVATYDGFISPGPGCCPTAFFSMYLAANGKIYLTTGSSTQHLHEINYPDSTGITCNVQQHAIDLLNYVQLRAVPNHPNYYLGCDTTSGCACLTTGLTPGPSPKGEGSMSITPNPSNGNFKISYLLPQNKPGVFEVFDVNGKKVFSYHLPPWSTMQNFSLPYLSDGIYQCVIKSGGFIVSKKLIIIK